MRLGRHIPKNGSHVSQMLLLLVRFQNANVVAMRTADITSEFVNTAPPISSSASDMATMEVGGCSLCVETAYYNSCVVYIMAVLTLAVQTDDIRTLLEQIAYWLSIRCYCCTLC